MDMIGQAGAELCPSPNFGPRRDCLRPDLVVLHYTAMTSAEAARDWLCNPEAQVSAHYVIAEDGRFWQLVSEEMRAWHAGAGAWGGVTDVNSHSIGIELANTGFQPFPEPQMAVLESLLAGIGRRWRIGPDRVIGHSDCATGRKIDPGRRFDWSRLARRGLAIRPDTGSGGTAVSAQGFALHCARFGYSETDHDVLLAAFRSRFRPRVSGPLDAGDCAMAEDLAARWPAPRG